MKTILFVLEDFPAFGGIEGVTVQLANKLVDRYKVLICSHHQKDMGILDRLDKQVILFQMPDKGLNKSAENINYLHTLICTHIVDVLIFQDSYFPNEYLLDGIKKYKNIKIIAVEHSSPNQIDISYSFARSKQKESLIKRCILYIMHKRNVFRYRRRRTRIYYCADKYVLLSTSLVASFFKHSFVKYPSKIVTIGNPVSLPPIDLSCCMKRKQCLFVGRLDVMKGLDRLVEIWKQASTQIPEWELVIVGDGKMMPYIKEEISLGHLQNVRLEGFKTDVSPYYEKASIFMMCSTFEGFPLVLPEAMSRGCVPVLFDSFPAARDIISSSIDGVLVKPFDIAQYSREIVSLAKDPYLLNNLKHSAYNKSQQFDLDGIVNKWIKQIES
ncbi:glycosyltransferase [Bacteroides sp.]|uniref:glycosyltransferase n=1 Tax=Bacteroides sp. TaxID=29523 RepID=UPI00261D9D77|nr:glycosyltransferase [Bacteroides sp.]MDD3040475.1 glycosyltransferase [Bacteroides sp.]